MRVVIIRTTASYVCMRILVSRGSLCKSAASEIDPDDESRGDAVAFASPEDIVRKALKVWAAGDVEQTMQYMSEDAVYALHVSEDLLPFGGETVGRPNIEAAFRQMRDQFDYLVFRPHTLSADGDAVRLRVDIMTAPWWRPSCACSAAVNA